MSSQIVVLAFATLLGNAHSGFSRMEMAAFIVRDASGALTIVAWPPNGIPDSAMWAGPIPDGAIAIAHTHPNWLPRPSTVDIKTARTVKMPVYVITRMQVWETAAGVVFRVQ